MHNSELSDFIAAKFIWINGKFVPWEESCIHVLTHSLHYAGSVFEGERAYKGRVFKLEEHTQRLIDSAKWFGMDVKYSAKEINDVTNELLEKNSLQYAYVRPLIWRGSESVKIYTPTLSVNILIAAISSKLDPPLRDLKLNLSKWRKPSPKALPPQAKSSAHYAMSVASQVTAAKNGYNDSLILDEEGFIAECTVSNIFWGKNNSLVTPIADRFLNGITRQAVIAMARNLGFEVAEERIALEELGDYDYCFITGTAKEVGSVATIDLGELVHSFPDPKGKIELLQTEFAKLVGK